MGKRHTAYNNSVSVIHQYIIKWVGPQHFLCICLLQKELICGIIGADVQSSLAEVSARLLDYFDGDQNQLKCVTGYVFDRK